jgi:DNA-binding NarL/FixJ family response regulator
MSDAPSWSEGPLRVLVVDADDRVRESLTGLLAIGDRVVVVGDSGQAGPAFDLATDCRPDVVIIDLRLPEVDGGLTFIARIRECCPEVRILAMSWSDAFERTALDGGAHGFVRKTFRPAELVAAILAAGRRPTDGPHPLLDSADARHDAADDPADDPRRHRARS